MTNRAAIEPDAMLQLKLEVPKPPANFVDRPRLDSALAAVDYARLLLVTAPAGFGKTMMLARWHEVLLASGHHVAWLTLDESDANPRNFLVLVAHALNAAGIDTSKLMPQAERGFVEMTIDAAMRMVIGAMAETSAPNVLVLDDYHRAANAELDELLGQIIALMPAHARIILGSRTRPPIAVPTLLASGIAAEITSDLLRFTPSEAGNLLDGVAQSADLVLLLDQAEGWPVALQLARLLLVQQHTEPLTRLTARGGHLSAFLTDEVLRMLPPDVADFLLETSILEKFTVEIADGVRDRTDSWQMMEKLEPLQSLVTPLDTANIWFRYHHLFAEYLQGLLRQRRSDAIATLQLRASQAFEQSGLLIEAVRHARDAGDFERCSELVERAGGWRLVLFGGMAQLAQLLDFIPHAERLARPRLLLAEAYLNVKLGHVAQARATLDLVESHVAAEAGHWLDLDEPARDALNVGMLIRVYADDNLDRSFLASFRQLRADFPDADRLSCGVLDCAGAVCALSIGQLDEAEDLARQSMGAMRSANSVLGLNYCYLHAGLASLYNGKVRTASAYLSQAQSMATENFGADSGIKAISDLLMSSVQLWRDGTVSMPIAELEQAFRHVCDYDGWFDIFSSGLDTRFRLALQAQDLTAIDAVIADGEQLAATRGLSRLGAIVDAQHILRQLVAGQPDVCAATIARLTRQFPLGCWRAAPERWRPYQDVGYALARWHMRSAPEHARAVAGDLIEMSVDMRTRPFEIRALLLRASAELHLGRHAKADDDILRALRLAVDESITEPFRSAPDLFPRFRQLRRWMWQKSANPLEAAFLSEIADGIAGAVGHPEIEAMGLSAREVEVMQELTLGLTNKEIARVLDMTEHTVKFHLKNIFGKMGVDRRARAISMFNETKRGTV